MGIDRGRQAGADEPRGRTEATKLERQSTTGQTRGAGCRLPRGPPLRPRPGPWPTAGVQERFLRVPPVARPPVGTVKAFFSEATLSTRALVRPAVAIACGIVASK
jgi:hypothetical protein